MFHSLLCIECILVRSNDLIYTIFLVLSLQSIVATPVSKALKIDFQPVKVPPDSKSPTEVAVLTFDCEYNLYEYILCVVDVWQ